MYKFLISALRNLEKILVEIPATRESSSSGETIFIWYDNKGVRLCDNVLILGIFAMSKKRSGIRALSSENSAFLGMIGDVLHIQRFLFGEFNLFLSYQFYFPSLSTFVAHLDYLSLVWKKYAPPKMIVFSWQLLLKRISTRNNLSQREVFVGGVDAGCVWCNEANEPESHLFLKCELASAIWYGVLKWCF